ncbi:hypothetical protein K437DRAFT_25336 [Tilletiaria anomala UBC 951]|uniref:BZIP domain-containing protein n=1 Tax=Tilletiaria anomala (strain ATCC 24038 / CBS 436.72 / UBC 951) TaxID=1037660 RepID=A0A066WML0_TILAU|nr:uncharacterized protein K437DRAFT_25336 [Tilletiaria anomala UBC 951]KDN52244.1 hypothetical protein K437DRAFT_25336 [Tilletiaria anomala UBC 951]
MSEPCLSVVSALSSQPQLHLPPASARVRGLAEDARKNRRREQNRRAQEAHRAKRLARLRELEDMVHEYELQCRNKDRQIYELQRKLRTSSQAGDQRECLERTTTTMIQHRCGTKDDPRRRSQDQRFASSVEHRLALSDAVTNDKKQPLSRSMPVGPSRSNGEGRYEVLDRMLPVPYTVSRPSDSPNGQVTLCQIADILKEERSPGVEQNPKTPCRSNTCSHLIALGSSNEQSLSMLAAAAVSIEQSGGQPSRKDSLGAQDAPMDEDSAGSQEAGAKKLYVNDESSFHPTPATVPSMPLSSRNTAMSAALPMSTLLPWHKRKQQQDHVDQRSPLCLHLAPLNRSISSSSTFSETTVSHCATTSAPEMASTATAIGRMLSPPALPTAPSLFPPSKERLPSLSQALSATNWHPHSLNHHPSSWPPVVSAFAAHPHLMASVSSNSMSSSWSPPPSSASSSPPSSSPASSSPCSFTLLATKPALAQSPACP